MKRPRLLMILSLALAAWVTTVPSPAVQRGELSAIGRTSCSS